MLELAQLIHQIATHPALLADPATLKALHAATHLSPQELQALLEVVRDFDWHHLQGSGVVDMLGEAAGWPDPRGSWNN